MEPPSTGTSSRFGFGLAIGLAIGLTVGSAMSVFLLRKRANVETGVVSVESQRAPVSPAPGSGPQVPPPVNVPQANQPGGVSPSNAPVRDLAKAKGSTQNQLNELAPEAHEIQRLAELKADLIQIAKAAGTDLFATKHPLGRGMTRTTARRYRSQLEACRSEMIALMAKLEPGTDLTVLERQLDTLATRLKDFEVMGD